MPLTSGPIGEYAPPDVADAIDQQMDAQRQQNDVAQQWQQHYQDFQGAVQQHAAAQADQYGDFRRAVQQHATDQEEQQMNAQAEANQQAASSEEPGPLSFEAFRQRVLAGPGSAAAIGDGAGGLAPSPQPVGQSSSPAPEGSSTQPQSSGSSQPATGGGGDVVSAIHAATDDPRVRMAMKLGASLEGGLGPTYGAGDGGMSWGPFQINHNAGMHQNIDRQGSEDPTTATNYMLGEYQQAVEKVPPEMWQSDPKQASRLAAFYAERPAVIYDQGRVDSAWNALQNQPAPAGQQAPGTFAEQDPSAVIAATGNDLTSPPSTQEHEEAANAELSPVDPQAEQAQVSALPPTAPESQQSEPSPYTTAPDQAAPDTAAIQSSQSGPAALATAEPPTSVDQVPPVPPETAPDASIGSSSDQQRTPDVKSMLADALHQVADTISGKATDLRTAMGAGDNPQVNPSLTKAPSEQTLGDVANIASTAATPISDAMQAVNPKNIGTAAAEAVTNAEGVPHKDLPSIPVLTGAADLAQSMTGPGGVLGNAASEPAAANYAGQVLKATRVPVIAGSATPATEAAGRIAPEIAEQNPGILGKIASAVNAELAPIRNTEPAVQEAVANYAGKLLEAQVKADTVRLEGKTLGPANDDVTALINREKGDLSSLTPEQQTIVSKWDQFNKDTGDTGRELGTIKGDVTAGTANAAPPVPDGFVRLYRGQHEPFDPEAVGVRSTDAGRYFTENPKAAGAYGDQKLYVDVPQGLADQMKAEQLEFNRTAHGQEVDDLHRYLPIDVAQQAKPFNEAGSQPSVYVPHVYTQDELGQADQAARKSGLNPSGFFSKQRQYATIEDAIAAGKTPVSMSEGQAIYTQRVLESQAKAELLNDLKGADSVIPMPDDIRDLPDGYRQLANSDPVLRGWAAPDAVAKVIDNLVSPSALRQGPIRRALMDAQSGAKMGLFSASNFHMVTELRQAYRLNGTDAGEALGKGIWNAVNPKAWTNFRTTNADAFAQAARDGVTLLGKGYGPDVGTSNMGKVVRGASAAVGGLESGVAGYTSAKVQGQSDEDAIKRGLAFGAAGAAGGAVIAPALTKALWERAVPTLKVLGYQSLKEAGVPVRQAATEVNTTFGGQNLEAIARSKTVQDILRLGVLAPDWWEGWARQFGTAFGKGTVTGSLPFGNPHSGGDAARAYWVRTAAEAAFLTEGLNYLFNGQFTDQNDEGHKAELELTGLYQKLGMQGALTHTDRQNVVPDQHRVYADVLGPIRSVVQSAIDKSPGEFAGSHVGMIPSTVMGVKDAADKEFKQSDDRGASVAAGATAGVQRLAPIGFQQAAQSQQPPATQAASFLTGTRIGEVSGGQEIQRNLDRVIQQIGGEKVWNALPSTKRAALMKAIGITTNPYSEKVREANSKINRQQTLQELKTGR